MVKTIKISLLITVLVLTLMACGGGSSKKSNHSDFSNPNPNPNPNLNPNLSNSYPLIAGMNIGEKNYDDPAYQRDLAKLDLVILGFYKGWDGYTTETTIRETVQELKRLNPKILIGQYTILNEAKDHQNDASDDIRAKITNEKWWLLNANKQKVQWTSDYAAWEVNFTSHARKDSEGNHYSQWRAKRDYDVFFGPVPEFDIWYFDNVFDKPRVVADFNGDGSNENPEDPNVQRIYRQGMVAEWTAARNLRPDIICMGNVNKLSSAEYSKQLDAGFLEALIGKDWSIEKQGWLTMMNRYRDTIRDVKKPELVIFNVHGKLNNYALLRYSLGSCLLDNGYFCYTDIDEGYDTVAWFDEYEINLGMPIETPPTRPWRDGLYRRKFQNGMVIVNPKGNGTKTITVESGYKRFLGKQDPSVNNGTKVTTLTLNARDGIILIKE